MASLYSDGSGSKLDQLYSDGGGSKIGQLYSSDPRGADGGLAADSREVKNRALEIKKAQRAGRRAYRLAMKSDNPAMAMQAREWAMEGKVPAGFSQAGRLAPAVANQANRTSALVNGQTGPVVQTPGRPPIGTRYADGLVEVGPSQAEAGNSTAGASREQQVDANGNARSMSLSEQAAAAAQKSQESGAFGTPTRFTFEKPVPPTVAGTPAAQPPAAPASSPAAPTTGLSEKSLSFLTSLASAYGKPFAPKESGFDEGAARQRISDERDASDSKERVREYQRVADLQQRLASIEGAYQAHRQDRALWDLGVARGDIYSGATPPAMNLESGRIPTMDPRQVDNISASADRRLARMIERLNPKPKPRDPKRVGTLGARPGEFWPSGIF